MEDLEGRIASTEAALNTANARLEEEVDSRAASSPMSPLTRGPGDVDLEPQLPDITDKPPQRGTGAEDDSAGKVEQLEELVAELQAQLKELHTANTGKQTLLDSAQVWLLHRILFFGIPASNQASEVSGQICLPTLLTLLCEVHAMTR